LNETAITSPAKNLPFITRGLWGAGWEIKTEPQHFVVEEIPVYEPVGEGGWHRQLSKSCLRHPGKK